MDVAQSTDTAFLTTSSFTEPTIQVDDILGISIQTIDVQSQNALTRQGNTTVASDVASGGQPVASGYLVDKQGAVEIPMLGKVQVVGLTTTQARDLIRSAVAKFYKEPTVQVRFSNFKVTVLGEVLKPGVYVMPSEKVTLLDAIGLAGDLTIYGKRENVLLVRDIGGKKEFIRFNLNSSDVFKSKYFYLKQNDYVYIEPTQGKVGANNIATKQTIATAASILSLLVVLITRL